MICETRVKQGPCGGDATLRVAKQKTVRLAGSSSIDSRDEASASDALQSTLRFPYHARYPAQAFSKLRWALNEWKDGKLAILNAAGAWLTIIDGFGAPGDTLLTATLIRNIRRS